MNRCMKVLKYLPRFFKKQKFEILAKYVQFIVDGEAPHVAAKNALANKSLNYIYMKQKFRTQNNFTNNYKNNYNKNNSFSVRNNRGNTCRYCNKKVLGPFWVHNKTCKGSV